MNCFQAKKGLSDDVKDIQSKALQTGHKLMASFFNESDLKKCLKNCDFCRIPEKASQQANALKTQRQESLYSRSQRQNGEAHEPFGYEPRQKKEEEEYSGFEDGLERMEKEEAVRLKTVVQDEFERRFKSRELANGGARCEAIVRTAIQALDDSFFQTGNQLRSSTTPAI
ncbi:hypothetical protein WR25_27110 [Diploscapter pachys]|uniref:ATP-dependent DNA helicase RecQ zinc-binding domain-containing protein n=1 Tax=Diploscapter pachys TaxID=2018661 RepID=A0A2A2KJE4_9BILA|nr:hypothetical protein WR25_27110 [Diploscapter pachys]